VLKSARITRKTRGRVEAAGSSTTSTINCCNWQKRRPFLPRPPK